MLFRIVQRMAVANVTRRMGLSERAKTATASKSRHAQKYLFED